jgi:hypothetical protein
MAERRQTSWRKQIHPGGLMPGGSGLGSVAATAQFEGRRSLMRKPVSGKRVSGKDREKRRFYRSAAPSPPIRSAAACLHHESAKSNQAQARLAIGLGSQYPYALFSRPYRF